MVALMAVLGIKVSPSIIWYAISELISSKIQIRNLNQDFRIPFPQSLSTQQAKVRYLFNEVTRIIDLNKDIDKIIIKENEYVRIPETSIRRFSSNLDGVIMAVGASKSIQVEKVLYKNLGAKKSEILVKAESISGKTNKYWNEDIAEVIVASTIGIE